MAISNISDLARVHGADRGDKVALRAGDRTITYGELDERSNRVANAADRRGCRAAGARRVPRQERPGVLRRAHRRREAERRRRRGQLAPRAARGRVHRQRRAVQGLHRRRGVRARARRDRERPHHRQEDRRGRIPPSARVVRGLDRAPRCRRPRREAGADDVALQFYSSGTTGLPKGVMLTNKNLFTAMDGLSKRLGFRPDSVNLVAMPLFHIGGGGWACVGLTAGCEDVIVREVDPVAIGEGHRGAQGHARVLRAGGAAVHVHEPRDRRHPTSRRSR